MDYTLIECCCGLDVHQGFIMACLLRGPANSKPRKQIRRFGTMPDDLTQEPISEEKHQAAEAAIRLYSYRTPTDFARSKSRSVPNVLRWFFVTLSRTLPSPVSCTASVASASARSGR